jgi:hypothetical protein
MYLVVSFLVPTDKFLTQLVTDLFPEIEYPLKSKGEALHGLALENLPH